MKVAELERVLRGVLLAGAPFALDGCLVGSSCPDNGTEPPVVRSVTVSTDFANGGPLNADECEQVCDEGSGVVTCVREAAESVLCLTNQFPCTGRRPLGLATPAVPSTTPPLDLLARHLARAAYLEAASVVAFRDLRRELQRHGAPRGLLRAASRSARDERRHARAAKALARRFGAAVPGLPCRHSPSPPRPLIDIALDNAVEGCVRETWGALIGLRQAAHAADPAIRATMRRIAPDEVRHAQLARAVDRWITPRLRAPERQHVNDARRAAFAELEKDAACALPASERHRLGLPGPAEGAALLQAFALAMGAPSPLGV